MHSNRQNQARITQVIANLLRNAICFTQGGLISITPDTKNDQAVISIRDTGNGISLEIYPKLFTKFVIKSEKGTGLGLFISKSIIEAHGGIHRMADEEKPYTTDTLNPFTSRNQTPLGHLLVVPGLNFEVLSAESLWARLK